MLSKSQVEEFASVLAAWQGDVLDEWVASSRRSAIAELPPEVLTEHLPALLSHLRDWLFAAARDESCAACTDTAQAYAFDRLAHTVDVVDCLREMDELRLILMRHWWAKRSARARPDELMLLVRALDRVVHDVVETYSTVERRVLAALDALTTSALEELPRDQLLNRLLTITVEAMPTIHTASVFLLEDERLHLRAAVGVRQDEISRFSLAVGEGFAGRVAASRAPSWTGCAATDPEVRSPALHQRGVRGLYGLPLISAGELLGVVTVGSQSEAQFSKLTQQLLRALSERAADVIAFDQRQRERRRLAKQIQEQRRRLDAVVRTIPAGIMVADAAGRVVESNEIARQIWGGEVPLVGIEDFGQYQGWWSHSGVALRPEDWALARAIRKGETSTGEVIDIRRFDGRRATILNNAAPILDADGHIAGAVVVFLDISEQRRTSRELEQQTAERSAILDSIVDGLIAYDSAGCIVRLNGTAQSVLDLSEQDQALPLTERLSRRPFARPDGRPLSPEETPVHRALHGQVVKGEMLLLHDRECHRRWISSSAAPVRLPSGEIGGAVATFVEVTHLQEMRERMEDFVRMVSHDLRTPLATANLQAHLLTRTPEVPESVHKRGHTIIRATSRMEHMIRDLVDAARLETGHLKVQLRPVEVRPFFTELAQRLTGVLAMDRVRMEVPEGLPAVQADPDRLERITVNLLSNALKYSPPEREVFLAARTVSDGVAISVRDRGQGIAADEVAQIFERYFRAKRADHSQTEGLGLGLYITRLLVQAHGGRISVESTPGAGTTFTVVLRTV